MSWLYHWLSDMLYYLGLISRPKKILLVGLDNAGKTTLLHMLNDDRMPESLRTHDPDLTSLQFAEFDLGGMPNSYDRRRWDNFAWAASGIVIIVDAADPDRMEEARKQVDSILNDEKVADIPFLILGNKIDRPGALQEEEFVRALGVRNLRTGNKIGYELWGRRNLEIRMCSIVKRQGYLGGLRWLLQFLS
ncbi:hypothetical protein PENTCL1PPCAC_14681 [Pristionchus entomophagus]|uniref:small monomeric GTPase n=1 Tax=Pristionchus entomophagus TaxID=358040 RepID=A0AAV5TAC8_9BILA|nr:hypothetical protein PENTCL1PPCAC_14681 [Pristionchus entomophagus]